MYGIYIQAGLVVGFFLALYIAIKFIAHLKTKRPNKELWATIFEGVTHKTMDLEPLKQPEVYIEKKAKRNGQSYDEETGEKQYHITKSDAADQD
jgi:hypothetical protein